MLRLKVNKTSLYRLVAQYEPAVCGFRRSEFRKSKQTYELVWRRSDCEFLASIFTRGIVVVLSIERFGLDGNRLAHKAYMLDNEALRKCGMVEEVKD